MRPALPTLRHQARSLQRLLDPAIAQVDVVLLAQLLVEMQHAEIEVLLLIQRQNALGCFQGNPMDAPLPAPLIKQSVVPEFLVSLLHPAHRPVRDAGDLRRRHPGDLLRQGLQYHVL
jgi:hypothetical protein